MATEASAMSNETLLANIQTVTDIVSRTDISEYARSALQRLLTEMIVEMAARIKRA